MILVFSYIFHNNWEKIPTFAPNIKPFFASTYGNSRLFTAMYNGRKVILKALKEECANDPKCRQNLKNLRSKSTRFSRTA